MKKKIQKIISVLIIVVIIFSVFFPLVSSADFLDELTTGIAESPIPDAVDGIVGIILYVPKLLIYAICKIIYVILSALVTSGTDTKVTPDNIIFAGTDGVPEMDLVTINFFDNVSGSTLKSGIASWYASLRSLAIIASLAVLIYVGIRMAISSVAETKAKYKNMLKDWAMGFVMLFVLHYLMVLVVAVNNELTGLIHKMTDSSGNLSDLADQAGLAVFSPYFIKGWGALIVYGIIAGISIAYFVMYVKRFFTVGFLITISPLITVTYSIDKMGDGKSQALNTWLREFIFNILIQPFHGIIYALLCTTSISALTGEGVTLKNIVVACASLLFVFKAEDIVKNIFGFKAGSLENAAAAGGLAWGVMSKFQSGGAKAANAAGAASGGSNNSTAKGMRQKAEPPKPTPPSSSPIPPSSGPAPKNKTWNPTSKFGKAVKAIGDNSAAVKATKKFVQNKRQDLHQFAADPIGTGGKAIIKGVVKANATAFKVAPKVMTGAVVAGITGNAATGIAAGYVAQGTKLTRKAEEVANKDLYTLQQDKNIQRLGNAIDNFKNTTFDPQTGQFMSDEEIYNKCLELYDTDLSTITDAAEKQLGERIQELKKLYEDKGEVDPAAKVMDKITKLQTNGGTHSIQLKTDSVNKAAVGMLSSYGSASSYGADQVKNRAREFMDDINKHGNAYLTSKDYRSITDKEQKKMAREIFRAKQVIGATGTASQEQIDNALLGSINNELNKHITTP